MRSPEEDRGKIIPFRRSNQNPSQWDPSLARPTQIPAPKNTPPLTQVRRFRRRESNIVLPVVVAGSIGAAGGVVAVEILSGFPITRGIQRVARTARQTVEQIARK